MRPKVAGPEIDHAIWRVEKHRIGVPLLDGCSETPVGAGERVNGADLLGHAIALDALRLGRLADQVESTKRLLLTPASVSPLEPFAPRRDIAKIVAMLFGEDVGDLIVGRFIAFAIRAVALFACWAGVTGVALRSQSALGSPCRAQAPRRVVLPALGLLCLLRLGVVAGHLGYPREGPLILCAGWVWPWTGREALDILEGEDVGAALLLRLGRG